QGRAKGESTGKKPTQASFGVWGSTGGDGKARFALATTGAWEFDARSDKEGHGTVAVDVPSHGLDHPIDLDLDAGVRCAGRIEFEGITPSDEQSWWIAIEPAEQADGISFNGSQAEVNEKQKTFTASGLTPGTWRATFYSPDLKPMMSQNFTL